MIFEHMKHGCAHTGSIKIIRGPLTEPFGEVIVFEDLYGNLWDLIQPA